MKLRTSFEMEIDVQFDDHEKAKAQFIDGDWKNIFWDLDDMSELAQSIAHGFHHEPCAWNSELKTRRKFIEGFGNFVKSDCGRFWVTDEESSKYGGKITISYAMELEAAHTFAA